MRFSVSRPAHQSVSGFLLLVLFSSCSLPYHAHAELKRRKDLSRSFPIEFRGDVRRFNLYVPPGIRAGESPALLILLHGRGGDEHSMARLTGGRFRDSADRYGYLILAPSAPGGHWEDGRTDLLFQRDGKSGDDMEYISFLVRRMEVLYAVDPDRVYLVGFSNGGMFALRMACEMPFPIRGVAAVAASLPAELKSRCSYVAGISPFPESSVRLLLIHGTQDPVVPFQGGAVHGGEKVPRGEVLSVAETMDLFARRNSCRGLPSSRSYSHSVRSFSSNRRIWIGTARYSYPGCSRDGKTEELDILGGGHTWPGSLHNSPENQVGKTALNLQGVDVILDFFFD